MNEFVDVLRKAAKHDGYRKDIDCGATADYIESLKSTLAERDAELSNLKKEAAIDWEKCVNEYESVGLKYIKEKQRAEKAEATIAEYSAGWEKMREAKKKIMNRVYTYTAMAMATEGGCKASELIEDESIDFDSIKQPSVSKAGDELVEGTKEFNEQIKQAKKEYRETGGIPFDFGTPQSNREDGK